MRACDMRSHLAHEVTGILIVLARLAPAWAATDWPTLLGAVAAEPVVRVYVVLLVTALAVRPSLRAASTH